MKLLLAVSDRDFLHSFGKLLEFDGHEVDTVFDGAQALTKIPSGHYDVVVLEQDIPRINSREIIQHLNEEDIAVIVILPAPVSSQLLSDHVLANEYLSLPFFPHELTDAVSDVEKHRGEDADITLEDNTLHLAGNRLCGRVRMTNTEIRLLRALSEGKTANEKHIEAYIGSINNKLSGLNRNSRIRYVKNNGYRLVMNHE